MPPQITVIIPNFNHATFLSRRIESVLEQEIAPSEILILDDCSTDSSRDIILDYQSGDRRIRTLFNDRNSGSPFRQWQRGLASASGKYVWIAESDDYADSAFLSTLVTHLEAHPNVGLACCQSYEADGEGRVIRSFKGRYGTWGTSERWNQDFTNDGKDEIRRFLLFGNHIRNASSAVFRRSLSERVDGRYAEMAYCGDWLFWIGLLVHADFHYCSQELNYFRRHQSSVSASHHRSTTEFRESLQVLGRSRRQIELTREQQVSLRAFWCKRWADEQLRIGPVAQLRLLAAGFALDATMPLELVRNVCRRIHER